MPDIEPVGVGEIEQTSSDDRRNLLAEQLEAAEPVQQAEQTEVKPAVDRARAPDGKFAPKTEASPQTAVPAAEPVQEPAWKKPLQSWKKDYHEHWGKLDPKLQEYIHQREGEMRAGVEQAIPKVRAYDAIAKVVQPYMENIKVAAGGDVPKAIQGLMEADNILRHGQPAQKRDYIMRLAQAYGVQLGDVSDAPQVSPELFDLRQQFAQMRADLDTERKAKEEAETRSLLNDIAKFAKDHEYFEEAKPTIVQLLQSGVASDLPDAYEKAIRLNDELFQSQQAALQAKAEQEKKVTKDQAAKAARSAAVSVRSSTPGTHTASKAQDRRSMLAEQLDGIGERL